MTEAELAVFNDLIDLTIAHASMIADLRRGNTALRHLVAEFHPNDFPKKFLGHWIDCDGRGEALYESRLAAVRKLAKSRNLLYTSDTQQVPPDKL